MSLTTPPSRQMPPSLREPRRTTICLDVHLIPTQTRAGPQPRLLPTGSGRSGRSFDVCRSEGAPMTMSSVLIDQVKRRAADEAERHAYPAGFPVLPPVPSGRYADPGFAALENEEVFGRSWLMVAHADELPEPGSYLQVVQMGKPIVLVRGDDGQVRGSTTPASTGARRSSPRRRAQSDGGSRARTTTGSTHSRVSWSATPSRTTSPTSTGTASPSPRSGARRGGP